MGTWDHNISQDTELKLPQYTREQENRSKVLVEQSLRKLPHKEQDTESLISLLSTLIDYKTHARRAAKSTLAFVE